MYLDHPGAQYGREGERVCDPGVAGVVLERGGGGGEEVGAGEGVLGGGFDESVEEREVRGAEEGDGGEGARWAAIVSCWDALKAHWDLGTRTSEAWREARVQLVLELFNFINCLILNLPSAWALSAARIIFIRSLLPWSVESFSFSLGTPCNDDFFMNNPKPILP